MSPVATELLKCAPPSCGVLLYVSSEKFEVDFIEPSWPDVRQLVMARNSVAMFTRHVDCTSFALPPLIKSSSECSRCFQASECMVTHAALERGTPETAGVPELFAYATRGLTLRHLKYLEHWDRLVDLEAAAMGRSSYRVWALSGIARQAKKEHCATGLQLESVADAAETGYRLILVKQSCNQIDVNLRVGDRVHISLEMRTDRDASSADIEDAGKTAGSMAYWNLSDVEPCMGVGNIVEIAGGRVCVFASSVSRRLRLVQYARGLVVTLRLDKDEGSMGVGSMRCNLLRLLSTPHVTEQFQASLAHSLNTSNSHVSSELKAAPSEGHFGNTKLRRLIVDLHAPRFSNALKEGLLMFCPDNIAVSFLLSATPEFEMRLEDPISREKITFINGLAIYPGCNPLQLLREYSTLNGGQREAIQRALAAEDYSLILGVPGSGKTSVLSVIVRALIARGKRVLISSHTNNAVDNLLSKLACAGVSPEIACRIGNPASVHSSAVPFLLDTDGNVDQLKEKCDLMRLAAATVLTASSHNLMASTLTFDYAVVDEAGQVSQPAVLGPLLLAARFCLVGDHYQLPPLVNSAEALRQGMDESLFKTLAERHPQAVVMLSDQYRMNAEIMAVANTLIYDERLRCADPKVAAGRICLNPALFQSSRSPLDWLYQTLIPANAVVFLNTDSLASNSDVVVTAELKGQECVTQTSSHGSVINASEVAAVRRILWALAISNYPLGEVGVLSPYRSQISAISEDVARLGVAIGRTVDCEVSTIDRFQGRDKNVIILSTVRSNDENSAGDLLRDWRRINVAVTRARRKLIILGSARIFSELPLLAALLQLFETRGWVYSFESPAFDQYDCPP